MSRAGRTLNHADWQIDDAGLVRSAHQVRSPNCDSRPDDCDIELLVIHNISLPPGGFGGMAISELFTNCLDAEAHLYFREIAGLRVSSHFLIRRDGELIQFVPCGMRAWHAGNSEWRGREQCNDFSIGVELEGTDDLPFRDVQYQVLVRLVRALRAAYPIRDCVGHSDIATPRGRKTDPGPYFDWQYFHACEHKAADIDTATS